MGETCEACTGYCEKKRLEGLLEGETNPVTIVTIEGQIARVIRKCTGTPSPATVNRTAVRRSGGSL